MNDKDLKDQARVLQRDLKALKEIQHPLYDYELYRAAKWLREEAGWHVQVMFDRYTTDYRATVTRTEYRGQEIEIIDYNHEQMRFDRYEQALEAAVETTLKFIINPLNEIEK